jgi:hypothetical protein
MGLGRVPGLCRFGRLTRMAAMSEFRIAGRALLTFA